MSIKDFILSNNKYFEDFVTRSTYHSNAIEGNTLSYAETYAILFNDNSFTVNAKPRELYEAINFKYALNYLINNLDELLDENLIKKLGQIINKNINEIDGYRHNQVYLQGAEYIPPPPSMVNQQMMYFVYNYNNTTFANPFERASNKHIEFERIHPFEDGNGRTGRLLINFEMLKSNLPPIIIPIEERAKYFELIANTDEIGLAKYFEQLSDKELQRLKLFGYEQDEPLNLTEQNKFNR